MKPSERIAKAFYKSDREDELSVGAKGELLQIRQELAEFLEREGIDRLFAIEAAAKDFFYGKTESRELENALRRLLP